MAGRSGWNRSSGRVRTSSSLYLSGIATSTKPFPCLKRARRRPSLEDVKTLVPFFVSASLALAQQSQTSNLTFDVNGRPVQGATSMVSRSPGSADRIETVRSINGRNVPVESVEDKVVSDSGGVK